MQIRIIRIAMYLKRLELHGFKSFAHKTTLYFEEGATAVVGPNGAGKSNIADAVRWVMGEQSLKILRGKKSEDVIFAGSDKKSRLSLAEVALLFDNRDHRLPLEYAEVVITRRLYRNGESEYLINNKEVRLLDITDLLIRSGFGAVHYTVIGQGMIDGLIVAGPTEIKNLVEEASGVKPYYFKKDKTIKRLTQTSENLAMVSKLLSEIEPRLRSLKRQAKRMEEREVVANELAALQLQFFGQQLYVLETELRAVADRAAIKSSSVKKLEAEISAFQTTAELEVLQTEKVDSFLTELEKKLAKLEERRLILIEQLAEIKGKLKVELPVTKNFSEFQKKFEAVLDLLRSDNIEEIKQKLRNLVSSFAALISLGRASLIADERGESKNEDLTKQKEVLSQELTQVVSEMNEQRQVRDKLLAEEKQKKSFLSEEEKKSRTKNFELSKAKDELNSILIEKARLDTRLENLNKEAREALGEKYFKIDQHKSATVNAEIVNKIQRLKHQLEMTGGVDEQILSEYRETEERYNYLSGQHKDLSAAVADLNQVLEELDVVIKKQFDDAFSRISEKFSEYFRTLFSGGKALMNILKEEVPDDDDLSAEALAEADNNNNDSDREQEPKTHKEITGIEIKATPPGKKLATVQALSGGERALTAIALLCALLAAYPSPFVVLDEVDAALDEANSVRFAKILGTLAHQTQFIMITHNRETMRQAHTLYGVTMSDEGISKVLSLKLEKAEAIAE